MTRLRAFILKVSFGVMIAVSCSALWSCKADTLPSAPKQLQTVPAGGAIALKAIASQSRLDPQQTLHLSFQLISPNQADLELTVQSLYTPGSPKFHQWLTPTEFGARFGATDTQIRTVKDWATANGMTVTKVWSNHLFVSADASVSAVEKAMNVHMANYSYRPQFAGSAVTTVFAPDHDPALPAAVASNIKFINGMTDAIRPVKSIRPIVLPSTQPSDKDAHFVPLTAPLNPSTFARIYDLDRLQPLAGSSAGFRIGIYSPTLYHQSDITTYLANYALTAPTPIETWPGAPSGTSERATDYSGSDEAALDCEVVLGLAQNTQITLYEANGSGNYTADQFNQMAEDDLPVISSSWVFSEDANFLQGFQALETVVQQMAAQGQALFCASGDLGAYGNGGTIANVGFPACSEFATGVGGSSLPYSDNGYWDYETAWSDSGGGLSQFFARPSWQTGPNVISAVSNGMRQVPDVALLADLPGVRIYVNGNWIIEGGTSVGPPAWAAGDMLITSALNQRMGNLAPSLYQLASDTNGYRGIFHDIDMGSNQLFDAGPGYDFVTGLGSADFYELCLYLGSNAPVETIPHGLEMVSVPYDFGTTSLSSIFDLASPIAIYEASTGEYGVSSSDPSLGIHPGNGYWVRTHDPINIFTAGTPAPAANFSLTSKIGWNMIGDPFTYSINLTHVVITAADGTRYSFSGAAKAGLVAPGIYSYDYEMNHYVLTSPTGAMSPYVGYWIDVYQPCTITLPSSG